MNGTSNPSPTSRLGTLLLGLLLATGACGDDAPPRAAPGGIDEEKFIATYVDLRATAIRGDSFAITDAERAAILARHGVTEPELVDFAERNGANVEYMTTVWNEVEKRLDAERVLPGASSQEAAAAVPDTAATQPPATRPRPR